MNKKKTLIDGKSKESDKEMQDLSIKNSKRDTETKVMEKIFSGSCCHSGMHAFFPNGKK